FGSVGPFAGVAAGVRSRKSATLGELFATLQAAAAPIEKINMIFSKNDIFIIPSKKLPGLVPQSIDAHNGEYYSQFSILPFHGAGFNRPVFVFHDANRKCVFRNLSNALMVFNLIQWQWRDRLGSGF